MLTIDEECGEVRVRGTDGVVRRHDLATPEAFEAVSAAWLRCGWDVKYVYSFTWFGRPVIQLPEDLIRMQDLVWRARPDVIVETGVAHGGSLVFYASLLAAMGHGRVIGVDIEIRPANRAAITAHALAGRIELIEGDSAAPETLACVRTHIAPGERVMVVLDSHHSTDHVRAELEAYAKLIQPGGFMIACDGIIADLAGAPRSDISWEWDNPVSAIGGFLAAHPEFEGLEPAFAFNEGLVRNRVTYWPHCFLRRRDL